MFSVGKALVSEAIIENKFICDLNACQGACCVAGAYGAPLEAAETVILSDIFEAVQPYLSPEGIDAIQEQGLFVKGIDGSMETPLIDGKACAYAVFTADGTAKCGLEVAYKAGATSWKKPISCHLYPIRIREYASFTAVNYHQWEICDPACRLGQELSVPLYKFVKEALIRKFGEAWYNELEALANDASGG